MYVAVARRFRPNARTGEVYESELGPPARTRRGARRKLARTTTQDTPPAWVCTRRV